MGPFNEELAKAGIIQADDFGDAFTLELREQETRTRGRAARGK